MTADRSGDIARWPTVQRITVRQWLAARLAAALGLPAPKVGKRRAGRARKPKPITHLLSSTAVQRATGTEDVFLPSNPEEDTAPMYRWRVRPTGHFTVSKEDR